MRVLVLGGTGSIGASVVDALLLRGHSVVALARSAAAAIRIQAAGAEALPGDIRAPATWIESVDTVDAVIQTACDFAPDAGPIDRALVEALLWRLGRHRGNPAFIYTGGCWLYGATRDQIATEETPFNAPAVWSWMIDSLRLALAAQQVRGIVIHPAMVYERDGGVLARFREDLRTIGRVRIVGNERVRWPMVHRTDIGTLYALALERGAHGTSYNGAAVDSVPVGMLASAMARRAGISAAPLIVSADQAAAELGEWARGLAIDQHMSGERARRDLGWLPKHTDPVADIS